MNKYKVVKMDRAGTKTMWVIEANNYSSAQTSVLSSENYVIELVQELDPIMYYQRSKRYNGYTLGNSTTSMQQYGCFLMCLSFIAEKDPIEVDKIFMEKGVYSNDLINTQKAVDALGLKVEVGNSNIVGKMTDKGYMPKFTCIKEVTLGRGQHFVVRLIDDKGKRSIFDPWTGEYKTINFYPFRSYRLIHK